MPLFLSDEEFDLCRHDGAQLAERADQFIRDMHRQLETVRAGADAASIAAEHTCSLIEQRYAAVSADHAKLQTENASLVASVEQLQSELAVARAEKHNLHLNAISKDGEIERLTVEASELHKSKRQLLELVEQKDAEIGEKNATIQSYLDKIIHLTDNAALKEAKLRESEAELARCHAECTRLSQEKELITRHNEWLNDELTVKVNNLIEARRTHMEYESEMSGKLADVERQLNETSKLLRRSEERVRELENRLKNLEEDLLSSKDTAAATEDHYVTELATVTKLAELHKESSEEWSKKAGELEGVIKALETHLSQAENNWKEKLENELSSKRELEKECGDLKEKLDKCEIELEKARKASEQSLLPFSSFQSDATTDKWTGVTNDDSEDTNIIVPRIPVGVSGTALAASLLRDGWSLAKMFGKYQEVADALRHERWERKHSETILARVLHEIEQKAELILDERAQHDKMVESYSLMSQKLEEALSVHDTYETTIRSLKVELKHIERDHNIAQKEIVDLQKQVTVLLKECRDIQLRCGVSNPANHDNLSAPVSFDNCMLDMEKSTSEHLMAFKDIHGLVEQNSKLRRLVHRLSDEEERREADLRETFQLELQKVTDEATAKVETVLRRSEEQGQMIESLHTSVAMYKRLYDEERRSRSLIPHSTETILEGKSDLPRLSDNSEEVPKKAYEQLGERVRTLEEDLSKSRNDLSTIRLERDKAVLEAQFSKEKLDSFMKEFEHQREQANGVSARNVELTQLLVDYQRKVREASDTVLTYEERSRKLSMEVSLLEHERDILSNSEKKALEEIRSLSERVHRLQSTLDSIQSADEVREEARRIEKMKSEDYTKHIEREWAEAKKDLQEERDRARKLIAERERLLENSLSQAEEKGKQLADAWQSASLAEARAAVAEARYTDLEAKIRGDEKAGRSGVDHSISFDDAAQNDSWKLKEELEKLKEEAQANKDYMMQYKEIAHTNEVALKNMESAHEEFKAESEKLKKTLEDEVLSLRQKVIDIEKDYMMKYVEASSAVEAKEEALCSSLAEIEQLKQENYLKISQIMEMEAKISALTKTVEDEHQRYRNAQSNYERQVILQSEAIKEMTKTSHQLSLLQDEISELRRLSGSQKAENALFKTSSEAEKSTLQQTKNEAERKYKEIDEQNKILLGRLEAMHLKLADLERSSCGTSFRSGASDSQAESDLQHVISYLRRSKEIAETEISLLKQEKLRLQSQLDGALKASETAQALLRSERENARTAIFTEEEFKSLQLQVREINLLRESNSQLREENKYNFEECQKLREIAQKAKLESEQLCALLRNKENDVEAYQKEIELWKMEKVHLESEISKLHENSKKINLMDYERLKDEFQEGQVKLKERDDELESTKSTLSKLQEEILHLQQEFSKCKVELDDQIKKISDVQQVEVNLRLDIERQKKLASHLKKKLDGVTRERDELNKENQSLQKQLEDFKTGKRATAEGTGEQVIKEKDKEKDTRIQMLESTLQRERDDLKKEREDNRKEKQRRQKMESTIVDTMERLHQEKKKLEEEIERHRHSVSSLLESSGMVASQLPSQSGLDEQAAAYFQAYNHFKETANSVLNERPGTSQVPSGSQPTDISGDLSASVSGQLVSAQRPIGQQAKASEQRERRISLPKPIVDARKRKLVRPTLEQSEEPAADVEMSEAEGSATAERGKQGESSEQEVQEGISLTAPSTSSRKRTAAATTSELKDDSSVSEDRTTSTLKRSKGLEALESTIVEAELPFESLISMPSLEHIDVSGALELLHESETIDNAEGQELNIKELAQLEEPMMGGDDNADTIGEVMSESREMSASLDDVPTSDGQDAQQSALEIEDEREEGELVLETSEQQIDVGESEELQPEINSGVVTAVGGDAEMSGRLEIDPSDALNEEKNERNENIEEVTDVCENPGDQINDNDSEPSPLTALGSPEHTPNVLIESLPEAVTSGATSVVGVGEQQGLKGKTDSGEGRSEKSGTEEIQRITRSGGTTIILTERAKERALMRQAGIAAGRSVPRGRGRATGGFRRDTSRGARGARGGRGPSSSDKEQS